MLYQPSYQTNGYITYSQSDQPPDGLIAESVEYCTDIVDVMGSNPVQVWILLRNSELSNQRVYY